MAPLPSTAGEGVTEGLLYRFIPNLEVYWEYDRGRPSPRAFRRRSSESDVSMYLDGLTTAVRLTALQPDFGLYAMSVEKLLELELRVVYDPDASQPEGNSKVAVIGVSRRRAELIAREVAECVKVPAPAAQTLSPRDEDRPADPWQGPT